MVDHGSDPLRNLMLEGSNETWDCPSFSQQRQSKHVREDKAYKEMHTCGHRASD